MSGRFQIALFEKPYVARIIEATSMSQTVQGARRDQITGIKTLGE